MAAISHCTTKDLSPRNPLSYESISTPNCFTRGPCHQNRISAAFPATRQCRILSDSTLRTSSSGIERKRHLREKKLSRNFNQQEKFQDSVCISALKPSILADVEQFSQIISRKEDDDLHLGSEQTLSQNRRYFGQAALSSIALPQPFAFTGSQDFLVLCLSMAGAMAWVKMFDELARSNVIEQKLCRKLVHVTTGLVFMLCWPFFSQSAYSRVYASLVPLANLVKILLLGFGVTKDEAAVRAMSREGRPEELLGGPLCYGLAFALLVLCFWRDSPTGPVALALLCGGDGFADIVGRRVRSPKLPWNPSKSWAGSLAMLLIGFLLAVMYVARHFLPETPMTLQRGGTALLSS
eukprot:TRINITY_DN8522_c0_g1_i2.p1 TRINITY_DN8522_c0_g1~~TRINITY_DN8522_c0_g1_i2.p1  ORF type:complete len:351 (+),score=33.45 TRINITY_DN8522_c0_g1_i2:245-1297(+)